VHSADLIACGGFGQFGQPVAAQPINYLQNLGGGTDPFLYERVRGAIILPLSGPVGLRKRNVQRWTCLAQIKRLRACQ